MISRCYLEITNICNLNCVFCAGHRRVPRMMTEDEFDALTDRLCNSVKFLYFHLMGEPMMNPSLPTFVRKAREKGFIPVLTTNGTLLHTNGCGLSPMAVELADSIPYKVNISLHSHEGNADSWMTLEDYIGSVMDFCTMATAKGTIAVLRLWNEGGYDNDNEVILGLIRRYIPGDWTTMKNGLKLADRLFIEYDSMFEWPDGNVEDYGDESFCYALRNQFGVLVDGTVVPCCLDHDGDMALGNLFRQPLDEILSSERATSIYDGFTRHKAVEPLCRKCGYAMKTKQYRQ